jgi:hypothetical protein
LEVGQSRKKGDFGKEGMHEGSDSWKEEKHTHLHGRPNDVSVMSPRPSPVVNLVFKMSCKNVLYAGEPSLYKLVGLCDC